MSTTQENKQLESASPAMAKMLTHEQLMELPGKEVVEKRTSNSKTYDLGGGHYQAVIYPEPVHCKNTQGKWIDINHSLNDTNGKLEDSSPELQTSYEADGSVTLTKNGYRLSWHMKGANLSKPENNAESIRGSMNASRYPRQTDNAMLRNEVVYRELYPDTEMVCQATGEQFKDIIRFFTASAVRPITYILKAPDLNMEQDKDGTVRFSAEGETIFYLPAPAILDHDGNPIADSASAVIKPMDGETWSWTVTVAPWVVDEAVKNNQDESYAGEFGLAFPLTLDPVVKTQQTSSAMYMGYTAAAKPNDVYPVTGYCVYIRNTHYNYGKCDAYLKYDDASLPVIDTSYYVTNAILHMTRAYSGSRNKVYIHEVESDWNTATLSYNNRPTVNSRAFDAADVTANEGVAANFNVTNQVRKWYTGQNYGFMLEVQSGNEVPLCGPGSKYHKPYIVIDYVSLAGLEGYLQMDEHACGRAGTAYVGLFNGNLVLSHSETRMNGQLMPVSISRFYNSCYHGDNVFGAGKGWKLSAQQVLYKETIGNVIHYVWMDGDGTRHHFKKINNVWSDLSGLGMKLTLASSTATITDKGDNTMVFDLPTAEFADNWANVKMLKSMSDACGNTAEFTCSGRVLTKAKDGANRETNTTITSGKITALSAPGTSAVVYGYNNDRLVSITHEDGVVTTYTYNQYGLLSGITNPNDSSPTSTNGQSLEFEYYNTTDPYRIKEVRYKNNGQVYGGRRYTYGDCRTTVTELIPHNNTLIEGKSLIYHFNDAGNAVSVNDGLGFGCFSVFNSNFPLNHPEFVSKMQRSVDNLLKDHNFIRRTDWTYEALDGTGSGAYFNGSGCYIGLFAYKLNKTSATGKISVYQTVTLTKGQDYTFSSYYKTEGNVEVRLRASYQNSSGNWVDVDGQNSASSIWDRTQVAFTLPANAASANVKVRMLCEGSTGTLWLDAAQLEDGLVMNRYNMLENSSFSMSNSGAPDYWVAYENNTSDDGIYTTATGDRPTDLPGNIVRINGQLGALKQFSQTILCRGNKDDVFTLGGWSFNYAAQSFGKYELQFWARPTFEDSGLSEGQTPIYQMVESLPWSREWSGWHFAARPIVMPWRYTGIRINIVYQDQLNYAEFSNIFLHKEEFGRTYKYDDKGNVLNVTTLASMKSGATYDSYNNLLTYHQPGRTNSDNYTLDWGSGSTELKKHLLKKMTSPIGYITENTYDNNNGNPKTSVTRDSSSTNVIRTSTEYTTDGNYVHTQTDARGKTVTTTTDANKGTVTKVTDPNNHDVNYTYDAMNRTTAVVTSNGGKTYRSGYTYKNDKLTEVKHNTTDNNAMDVVYRFGFDNQDRPTTTSVGDQNPDNAVTLSTNVYNTDSNSPLYGTLTRVDYGNGGKIAYTYDEYKRVVGIRFDNDTADRYTYKYGANGQVGWLKDNALNRVTFNEYDMAERPVRITHTEGSAHLYTGEVDYDEYNNLKTFKEKVGSEKTAYRTGFSYDRENKPIKLTYGDENNKVEYAYDSIGRMLTRKLKLGGNEQQSSYTYLAGNNGIGNTTGLISGIVHPHAEYHYTYDNVGNIASVTTGHGAAAKVTSYVYDSLGQLIRVNDQTDTTAGTTWTFEYDRGGNILNKKRYAYTTGTLGSVLQTISYGYDTTWKDKLVSYNGTAITYDEIGNPLNDGTWTYEWEKGRQLKEMRKGTINVVGYQKNEYRYNADGLRIQKTVTETTAAGTTTTTTNYTLHGKNIVHLTQGNHDLHFFYDASNRPAVVEYNETRYGYVHNLQGDICQIVDTNGNVVVEYTYDAWGKVLSTTGSMASSLGSIQPFRYRGYVYDVETGLYYLMTRYYNSKNIRFINSDNYVSSSQDLVDQCSFLYCGNNPICREDRTGEFFNTIFGTIIGAAWAVLTKSDKETVRDALIRGAVTGFIAGAGLDICIATAGTGGMIIAAVTGAVGGALDTAWEASNNGEQANIGDVIVGGTVGAGMNMLFGAAGREIGRTTGNTVREVFDLMKNNVINSVSGKSGRIIGKKVLTVLANNALSSSAQAVYGKIYSRVGSTMLAEFTQ